jgi:DUF1680 family protein
MKKLLLPTVLVFCLMTISAQKRAVGQTNNDKLSQLIPSQVKVGGEFGRRMDITVYNNIFKIDADHDFLASFQKREDKNNYIGLGKLIDTVVKMAVNAGDEKVIALKNHLIDAIINTQESDGYIGNMVPGKRIVKLWDVHEIGYIIFGLTSDYNSFRSEKSLNAARKAADYLISNWQMIPGDWEKTTNVATHVGITGIDRTMVSLYKATGDKRYMDFCLKQDDLVGWNPPIVMGRRDLIEGHIYSYVSTALAQMELFRMKKDKALLAPTIKVMNFITAQNGMTITGGIGQQEIWTDDQDGRGDLGETCATAYQIRLYDNLLRFNGDSRYGDMMERAIYNALFGAQSPDGRQIRYFTPFEGPRAYHNTDTYCCPCNYRRVIAELPSFIFYRDRKGLSVNLYTTSKAEIQMGDYSVAISQETEYPSSGHVVLHIDPSKPATFTVRMRIPLWCKNAYLSLNGKPLKTRCEPGKFAVVENNWKAGDQVTLEMPMHWRLVKGRQRQAGRVAVMRGPLVFCLRPEKNSTLGGKDAADLGNMIIDLANIEKSPVSEKSVRPDGIGCRLKAGSKIWAMGNSADITLTLSEFADPDGKCTYFRTPDLSKAVDDELTGAWQKW